MLVLNGPNLVVTAGRTRDLGNVGLIGGGDGGLVLTVAPRPAADGSAMTVPEQPAPAPAPDPDPAAQQPDPGLMTDGSN